MRLQNGVSCDIFELFSITLTTDHCRYVRRPVEHQGPDPSLVKSKQDGGLEEVDSVVDSFIKLADVMKGL